ncbi:secreted RxLR effector protein 161-like protein [Tanacetum coccineum]
MTRRSRTGYLLLLGGAPVSWKTKKQSVVSKSSAEAEYRAMSNAVSEILWMRWLLGELDMAPVGPTALFCDNQAARHIANNPVFHERTKHVEMDCYFVRERVDSMEICPMPIATKDQIADVLTKALGANSLRFLLYNLEGISQLLAVLDVHVAVENKVSGESDYYGILGAEGAFQLVSQAWNLLSDKDKRLAYDRKRHAQFLKQSVNTQNVFTRVHIPPTQNGFHNVTKSTARAAGADAQTKLPARFTKRDREEAGLDSNIEEALRNKIAKKEAKSASKNVKSVQTKQDINGLDAHKETRPIKNQLIKKATMEIKKKLDEWSSEAVKVADMANGYSKSDEADVPDPDFHDFDIERSEKCFKEESAKAPKGCLNLDPAAIPLEFLHVLADVKEADKMDIDNVSRRE